MTHPWPSCIMQWPDLGVVEFPDEPKIWWWTDTHVLLRGVGDKPVGYDIKVKKEFYVTAALAVKRARTKWERCIHEETERVRALKNKLHGLNVEYYRLLEHWPKHVKWLVPENRETWNAASLAVEADSNQIVAVIMPMKGAERWKAL